GVQKKISASIESKVCIHILINFVIKSKRIVAFQSGDVGIEIVFVVNVQGGTGSAGRPGRIVRQGYKTQHGTMYCRIGRIGLGGPGIALKKQLLVTASGYHKLNPFKMIFKSVIW